MTDTQESRSGFDFIQGLITTWKEGDEVRTRDLCTSSERASTQAVSIMKRQSRDLNWALISWNSTLRQGMEIQHFKRKKNPCWDDNACFHNSGMLIIFPKVVALCFTVLSNVISFGFTWKDYTRSTIAFFIWFREEYYCGMTQNSYLSHLVETRSIYSYILAWIPDRT